MKVAKNLTKYAVLGIFLLFSVFPFYWMIIGSTNPSMYMFLNPPRFNIGIELLNNLSTLDSRINVFRILLNSTIVSIFTLVLSLTISAMAAYALSKFKFKGSNLILMVLLISQMIPVQTRIIPLFRMMAYFNLLNTYFALIAPILVYPLGIFLLKQNFEAVPDAILESARLDGANELMVFLRIVLPSMKPALAATSILIFMNSWNNFMWPLVASRTADMFTFPVALSSLTGATYTDYGQIMTGLSIATIPIVIFFLILQKHFVSGMLGSAVK